MSNGAIWMEYTQIVALVDDLVGLVKRDGERAVGKDHVHAYTAGYLGSLIADLIDDSNVDKIRRRIEMLSDR